MGLKQIYLHNFRNFKKKLFNIHHHLTIVVGENALGKTNILESIYFIACGHGFRESKEEELIHFDETDLETRGVFYIENHNIQFQIILQRDVNVIKRHFFINKTKKKFHTYQKETTKVVLFSPEQIAIITGSPEKRRNYFDKIISSYDFEYKKRLYNLENALYKRNKILEHNRDEKKLREELQFWNEYLEKQASYLTLKRQEYIDFLNAHSTIDNRKFYIEYVKNELTQKRLEEIFEKEKIIKKTLIGPQKDDFIIFQEKNLSKYGSRSEQRLGIFWLKVNEIIFYEKHFQRKPILLLDDIFSELDAKNKKLILTVIQNYQTIITSTEEEIFEKMEVDKKIIRL